jgi:hypothetical protein
MCERAVAFILWPRICPLGAFSCHRMDVGAVLFILWRVKANGERMAKEMVGLGNGKGRNRNEGDVRRAFGGNFGVWEKEKKEISLAI